mgnify:CR=1 FL=1
MVPDKVDLQLDCAREDTIRGFAEQFAAFEAESPADLAWDRLDRLEKLVVCERLVRSDKTLADFTVEE